MTMGSKQRVCSRLSCDPWQGHLPPDLPRLTAREATEFTWYAC